MFALRAHDVPTSMCALGSVFYVLTQPSFRDTALGAPRPESPEEPPHPTSGAAPGRGVVLGKAWPQSLLMYIKEQVQGMHIEGVSMAT